MTLAAWVSSVMADTPWGFWQMQETSGTSLTDSSGGSHGGNYDATVVPIAGPYSGWSAARFVGTGALVAGVYATGGPLCFEYWFCQRSSSGTQIIFGYGDSARTQGVEQADKNMSGCGINGAIDVFSPDSGWVCVPGSPTTVGNWYHCALQHESDNHWRWYIAASTDSTHTVWDLGAHSSNVPSSPALGIGKRPAGTGQVTADMAGFAFYNSALTLARLDAHLAAAASVAPPPSTCQYGTRKKAGSPVVDLLTEALIVGILEAAGLHWWEVLLLVFAGQQLDVNALCATLPPQPPPPTPDALNYPPYKLLEYLYQNVWNYYCECVPGTPVAPPPPNGTATKPDGMPDTRIIVVNPTNPCLDITEVRRMLDTIIRQLNIDVQLDTLMQRYMLPFATIPGAAHSGLTGAGSFAISRLIGVQVVITARPPNRELEGAPNYIWDLGWLSIMDGNGFIQERRLTRDVEVWMPGHFQEAITFGYSLKSGVTARITELEAET